MPGPKESAISLSAEELAAWRQTLDSETNADGRALLAWAQPADGGNAPLLAEAFAKLWRKPQA